MYHSFLIHSFADAHLGCFHVLAIINSAATYIGVHVSFNSDFLGVYAQQWDCWIIRQFYFQFFKESLHLTLIFYMVIFYLKKICDIMESFHILFTQLPLMLKSYITMILKPKLTLTQYY